MVDLLILDRGEHPDGAVSALPVVEHLDVFEHRRGQLEARIPTLAIQQFGLHSDPE